MRPRSRSHEKPLRSVVDMFMREARSLAKLRHPNIVGVHRAFEENDTAYMVLDLIDGPDLFDIISSPVSPARVRTILWQLLDAIEKVHEVDLLHRDISPDNILIERSGNPVLIDFGAARAEASRHTRAVSSLLVVKDGYSPHELYVSGSEQSPSSDLYALAATFYHVITGHAPPDSQTRMFEIAGRKADPCVPLAGRIEGYDQDFLQAIDTAMQIHPSDRLQTAAKWKSMIRDAQSDTEIVRSRPRKTSVSLELERSLTRLVEETNDEVRRTSQVPDLPQEIVKPPEPARKPKWIEEFNRETLTPQGLASAAPETVTPDDCGEDLDDGTRRSARFETNWIARAREKQDRIRSERERQLGLLECEAHSGVGSHSGDDAAQHADATRSGADPATGYRPSRIVAGLLVSFSLILFLRTT